MNSAYTKAKTKDNFEIPKGRLAKVSSIQQYYKGNKKKKYDGKRDTTEKDYNKVVMKEAPDIHKYAPELLNGKLKKNYMKNDIFEIDNKPAKKFPEPKFAYIDEKTGRFN